MEDNNDMAFTGKISTNTPDVNIKDIETNIKIAKYLMDEQMKYLAKTFSGIPVRIDKTLKGEKYYIAVSPELHAKLEGLSKP